jgi:hypothetical protein
VASDFKEELRKPPEDIKWSLDLHEYDLDLKYTFNLFWLFYTVWDERDIFSKLKEKLNSTFRVLKQPKDFLILKFGVSTVKEFTSLFWKRYNRVVWTCEEKWQGKRKSEWLSLCTLPALLNFNRSIYLAGGMSRLPNLGPRLEAELRAITPASMHIKVNCSPFNYHCSYLGSFKFIAQPEYESLIISREQWSVEKLNCLRKWRML